jgi:hypothetical protein
MLRSMQKASEQGWLVVPLVDERACPAASRMGSHMAPFDGLQTVHEPIPAPQTGMKCIERAGSLDIAAGARLLPRLAGSMRSPARILGILHDGRANSRH